MKCLKQIFQILLILGILNQSLIAKTTLNKSEETSNELLNKSLNPDANDLLHTPPNWNDIAKGLLITVPYKGDSLKFENRFDSFKNAIVVYTEVADDKKCKRKGIDITKFDFKCDTTLCTVEQLLQKIGEVVAPAQPATQPATQPAAQPAAGQVAFNLKAFLDKNAANGIKAANCLGDTYLSTKIHLFCFADQNELTKFQATFNKTYEANKDKVSALKNLSSQPAKIFVTDGDIDAVERTFQFNDDGVYENNALLFRYDAIDNYNDKKCVVTRNLNMAPTPYYLVNVFNPSCLIKFSYDLKDIYFGSNDANCELIMTSIQDKMKNGCLKGNSLVTEKAPGPIDTAKGIWSGFIFFASIGEKGQSFSANPLPILISENSIKIDKSFIDLSSLKWLCNNDGFCSLDELSDNIKALDDSIGQQYQKLIGTIKGTWKIEDYDACFTIPLQKEVIVLCPVSLNDELDIRRSASIAVDNILFDAQIDNINTNYANEFNVLTSTESDSKIKAVSVVVTEKNLLSKEGKSLLEFKDMAPFKGEICAIQFRNIDLTANYHDKDQDACAVIYTEEKNYFCIQEDSKSYLKLRSLIKKIKERCLKIQGQAASNQSSTIPDTWTGQVIYMPIDNYKYKGQAVTYEGTLKITEQEVELTGESKHPVWAKDLASKKFNIFRLVYPCQYGKHCTMADFNLLVDQGMEQQWQITAFQAFTQAYPKQNVNICFIMVQVDPFDSTTQAILVCPLNEEVNVSAVLSRAQNKRAKTAKLPNDLIEISFFDIRQKHEVLALKIGQYDTNPDTKPVTESSIFIDSSGIQYANSGREFLNYMEIIDEQKSVCNLTIDIVSEALPKGFDKYSITGENCFKAFSNAGPKFYVCGRNKEYGSIKRLQLTKYVLKHCNDKIQSLKKPGKSVERKQPNDPYMFGQMINYKKWPQNFNFKDLATDTVDQSINGLWKGWVYAYDITSRESNAKLNPVWCEINSKYISLKQQKNSPSFQNLNLIHYRNTCKEVCTIEEYVRSLMDMGANYSEIFFLKSAVENVMSHLTEPNGLQCVILDIENGKMRWVQSWIFCVIEFPQIKGFKDTIINNQYLEILNANIDNDIPQSEPELDLYKAKVYVNEKVIPNVQSLYVSSIGLIGLDVDPTNMSQVSLGSTSQQKPLYQVKYSEIAEDIFSTSCAFWYKGLKIKERNEETKKEVYDNNCCFKLYRNAQSLEKHEICIQSTIGGNCLKQSRALMKALKKSCLRLKSSEPKIDANIKKSVFDDKKDPTKDFWSGYGYLANIYNTESIVKRPILMKINPEGFNFYSGPQALDKAIVSIDYTDVIFNCEGNKLCTWGAFAGIIEKYPYYASFKNTIQSTIITVKQLDVNILQKVDSLCLIIESASNGYIFCPLENSTEQINAIVPNVHMQRYQRLSLPEIKNVHPGKVFSVTITASGAKNTASIVIRDRKILNNADNVAIFDLANVNTTPQDKSSAATACAIESEMMPTTMTKTSLPTGKCCFRLSKVGLLICVTDSNCVSNSFKLMRLVYDNCLDNSNDANHSDQLKDVVIDDEVLSTKSSYNPKVKFDFRNRLYGICVTPRKAKLIQAPLAPAAASTAAQGTTQAASTTPATQQASPPSSEFDKKITDPFNYIHYSPKKPQYSGFVTVYSLNTKTSDLKINVVNRYAVVNQQHIALFKNHESQTPENTYGTHMITKPCQSDNCKPTEYISNLVKEFTEFSSLETQLTKIIDLYENGSDDGCTVINPINNGETQLKVICVSIRKLRSNLPQFASVQNQFFNDYLGSKKSLSAFYGNLLRKTIYNSAELGKKTFETNDSEVLNLTTIKTLRIFDTEVKDHQNVSLQPDGLYADNKVVFSYSSLTQCKVAFNIVHVVPNALIERRDCCLRIESKTVTYMCMKELNCFASALTLSKLIANKCATNQGKNSAEIINELHYGPNAITGKIASNIINNSIMLKALSQEPGFENQPPKSVQTRAKMRTLKALSEIREIILTAGKAEIKSTSEFPQAPATTEASSQQAPASNNPELVLANLMKGLTPRYSGQIDQGSLTISVDESKKYSLSNGTIFVATGDVLVFKTSKFCSAIYSYGNFVFQFFDTNNMILNYSPQGIFWTSNEQDVSNDLKSMLSLCKSLAPDNAAPANGQATAQPAAQQTAPAAQ